MGVTHPEELATMTAVTTATDVTATIAHNNADAVHRLPFHDTQDFEDATRGRIGGLEPAVVTAVDGSVVWDNRSYSFLESGSPSCVNPSLWRQGTLVSMHGLYEVVEGIYQVRGLDLSNITFVEGERGVIVIDPLISADRSGPPAFPATANYGPKGPLVRDLRPGRPPTGSGTVAWSTSRARTSWNSTAPSEGHP